MTRFVLRLGFAISVVFSQPAGAQDMPRLLVFISVDQMRADYLERFSGVLEHGLADLSARGVQFTNTHHAHAMTETAPGHATLVSGVNPSRTGIPANEWWDRVGEVRSYAAEDVESPVLGAPLSEGRSPALLLRTMLGDWLKSASPDSKVYSVAIKDRVSVLMGGKQPNEAYWYDTRVGRYVTSTYYASEYPDWLNGFNDTISTAEHLGRTWERKLAEAAYTASRADSFYAEYDGVHVTFPHVIDLTDTLKSPYVELITTPFGDEMSLALAREFVERESLGKGEALDVLFLGLSSGDYIGHRYGPYSQEMEDYYIRLDAMLGDFVAFLDESVGRNGYVTVLTADHGVVRVPEYSNALGEPGHRVTTDEFREELVAGLTEAMGELEIYAQPSPLLMYPLGLVLRFQGDEVSEEQMSGVRKIVAEHLRATDVFQDVFTYDEMMSDDVNRGDIARYRKSFHPERSADLILQYKKHDTFPPTLVTNHGSPYTYDTHVPLIVVAPGLEPQKIARRVWTVDIAPSVAAMFGFATPADLDGSPIEELRSWTLTPSHR